MTTDASSGGERIGSAAWMAWRRAIDLDEYEARFDRIAAGGGNPHGEVDFVMRYAPRTALDAGCGFGRVAIELHRRGVEVVGVDLDPDLLARARRRAPELEWHRSDLVSMDLGRTFDLVVLAGNVIGFVEPDDRPAATRACARHVAPGGHLIIGNQLRPDWPTADDLESWSALEGLVPVDRLGGWDGEPPGGDFVVSVVGRPR